MLSGIFIQPLFYFLFIVRGFPVNFFAGRAGEVFFTNFRGAVTFSGTGNTGSLFADADIDVDEKLVEVVLGAAPVIALAATGRDCGIVSKMRNIVSIFVFMAPI
jgi:hypothetical protein